MRIMVNGIGKQQKCEIEIIDVLSRGWTDMPGSRILWRSSRGWTDMPRSRIIWRSSRGWTDMPGSRIFWRRSHGWTDMPESRFFWRRSRGWTDMPGFMHGWKILDPGMLFRPRDLRLRILEPAMSLHATPAQTFTFELWENAHFRIKQPILKRLIPTLAVRKPLRSSMLLSPQSKIEYLTLNVAAYSEGFLI